MKISAVTTWPPYREGIAIYSEKLYTEVAAYVHVDIIANQIHSDQYGKTTNITLYRIWTRNSPFYLFQILSKLVESKIDVVHLQHGWFLYGKAFTVMLFPILILLLRLAQKKVVVTMHTIIARNAQLSKKRIVNAVLNVMVLTITRILSTFTCKMIVHNKLMKSVLKEAYHCKNDKITVIPHGIDKAKRGKRSQFTSQDGNNNPPNVLSLGFIRENKELTPLLKAFRKINLHYPDARLIIAGGTHPHDDEKYLGRVKTTIADMKLESVVLLNFVKEELLNYILDEADIVVLLSRELDLIETSGTLARVADFEKPLICSRVPKFQSELVDGYDCVMVNTGNFVDIYEALERLIREVELRECLASNLKKRFTGRYWDCVAKRHVELYRSL